MAKKYPEIEHIELVIRNGVELPYAGAINFPGVPHISVTESDFLSYEHEIRKIRSDRSGSSMQVLSAELYSAKKMTRWHKLNEDQERAEMNQYGQITAIVVRQATLDKLGMIGLNAQFNPKEKVKAYLDSLAQDGGHKQSSEQLNGKMLNVGVTKDFEIN